jgi:DNA-directed RNA polymerase subunit RPC12/RpoP
MPIIKRREPPMAIVEVIYVCLRCGHRYEGEHDSSKGAVELTCPKCKSNSVRRMPKKE